MKNAWICECIFLGGLIAEQPRETKLIRTTVWYKCWFRIQAEPLIRVADATLPKDVKCWCLMSEISLRQISVLEPLSSGMKFVVCWSEVFSVTACSFSWCATICHAGITVAMFWRHSHKRKWQTEKVSRWKRSWWRQVHSQVWEEVGELWSASGFERQIEKRQHDANFSCKIPNRTTNGLAPSLKWLFFDKFSVLCIWPWVRQPFQLPPLSTIIISALTPALPTQSPFSSRHYPDFWLHPSTSENSDDSTGRRASSSPVLG